MRASKRLPIPSSRGNRCSGNHSPVTGTYTRYICRVKMMICYESTSTSDLTKIHVDIPISVVHIVNFFTSFIYMFMNSVHILIISFIYRLMW